MSKCILITGASGFTGSHAVKYFSERGYRVIGTSRRKVHSSYCVMENCDLSNLEQTLSVVKKHKPDLCLHLAGINSVAHSWSDPLSVIQSNVLGTFHLLEGMRLYSPSCKTIIAGSALSGSNHPYAVSKNLQQQLCTDWAKVFNLQVLSVRLCNLIGPGHSSGIVSLLAKRIVDMEIKEKTEPIELSHLLNEREFLDVRDAVACYDILFNKGESYSIYEIGSGKMTSLVKILTIYQSLTTIQLSYSSIESKPDSSPKLMQSNSMRNLGWKPTYLLGNSLSETLSFYRNHDITN